MAIEREAGSSDMHLPAPAGAIERKIKNRWNGEWAEISSSGVRIGLKWIDKPGSVMTRNKSHSDHSSCPRIAPGVERPYPRATDGRPSPPIWPCSRWGLPCTRHYWRAGELLPRLFNLTVRESGRRYVFCGTFLRSLGAVVNGHPVLRSPDFPPSVLAQKAIA